MGKNSRLKRSNSKDFDKFWKRHIAIFCSLNGCVAGRIRKGTKKEDTEKAIDWVVPIRQPDFFAYVLDGKTIHASHIYVQAKAVTNRNDFQLTADYQKQRERWKQGERVPDGEIEPAWGVLSSSTEAEQPHFIAFGFPDHRPKDTALASHKEWPIRDCVFWVEYDTCIETIKTNLEQWKSQYGYYPDMGEKGRERTWCVFFPAKELWRLCYEHPHSVITFGDKNTAPPPEWMIEPRLLAKVTPGSNTPAAPPFIVCVHCNDKAATRLVLELNAYWCDECVINEKVDKINGKGGYSYWSKN